MFPWGCGKVATVRCAEVHVELQRKTVNFEASEPHVRV